MTGKKYMYMYILRNFMKRKEVYFVHIPETLRKKYRHLPGPREVSGDRWITVAGAHVEELSCSGRRKESKEAAHHSCSFMITLPPGNQQ